MRKETVVLLLWNGLNLLLFAAALTRQSDSAVILGRYSTGYALGLAFSLVLTVTAALLTLTPPGRRLGKRIAARLNALIPQRGAGLVALVVAVIIALSLLWALPFDLGYVEQLVLFNLVMAAVVLVSMPVESAETSRAFLLRLFWVLLISVLIVSFLSAPIVPQEQSSGDESAWTSMAQTWLTSGQAYIRINGHLPIQITPGVGWWVAPYGLWLGVFGVSLSAGRLFIWVIYLLAVISSGWVGARLYGRQTGLTAAVVTAVSLLMLSYRIIRPEIGLAVVGPLLVLAWLASRKRSLWAAAAGWLAVLSLEIHAAGLAYIVALLILYGLDALIRLFQRRNPLTWQLVAVVAGMAVGTLGYLALHILIHPNPETYFSFLRSTRGFMNGLPPLDWFLTSIKIIWERAPLEFLLMVVALVILFVRRSEGDRLALRFFGATAVGYFLLVPEPFRYLVIFMPFIAWGIAALISYGYRAVAAPPRPAVSLLMLAVLCAPFFAVSLPGVSLNPMRPAELSPVTERVRELTAPEDVVVGDPFAYWGLTDYPQFYSSWSEYEVFRDLGYPTGYALWSALAPELVFHTYTPGYPQLPVDLKRYLGDQRYLLVDSFEWEGHRVEFYRRPES